MAPLLPRWPLTRLAPARNVPARTAPGPARLDVLLKNNPVLTVSALQAPDKVAELVAAWNPAAAADLQRGSGEPGSGQLRSGEPRSGQPKTGAAGRTPRARTAAAARAVVQDEEQPPPPAVAIGDAIRWYGPIRLTPMLRADAGLPASPRGADSDRPTGGFAYVAEVRRSRAKIVDGRHAAELRRRYPQGIPTGAEAEAWSLVRGLAKRLRGVAHLPGSPAYTPHADREPLVSEHDCRVYSHEMLPWIVLREILRPLAPSLTREPLPEDGGYILRQRGVLEVRVRPAGADPTRPLPYVIRDRADEAWPHSVYEFCDMSRSDEVPAAPSGDLHLRVLRQRGAVRAAALEVPQASRHAASLIAEVTGGVLVDTDGFPVPIRALRAQ